MAGWSGQTALVTGAGSGIGEALARALRARGVFVVVTDVDEAQARRVAGGLGKEARAERLDVRDAAAWGALVDDVERERGRVDQLYNNAGIGVGGEAHELDPSLWERVLDVNVRGVVHGVNALYPRMVRRGAGHIVNVASMAGLAPAPLLTPYAMTKHAVVGLSTSLRMEGADLGVRVTVICPAAIETPLLDKTTVEGLPPPPWLPDIRRYLTRLAGPPYPVDRMASEALDAVERNEGLVVIPAAARAAARGLRYAPWLVEKLAMLALRSERKTRPRR